MKDEIRKILNRKEFYFVLVLMLVAVFVDYLYECYIFKESSLSGVISAYDGTILSRTAGTPFAIVFELLLPICASVMASTSSFEERSKGINTCIVTRMKQSTYLLQQGAAILFTAFFVVLFVLLISLSLSLVTFPIQGFNTMFQADYHRLLDIDHKYLFDFLYRYHPYINIIVFIVLRAMFAGLFAWFAYGISFLGQGNKITIISSPFIFIIILQLIMQVLKQLSRRMDLGEEVQVWFSTKLLSLNHYGRAEMLLIIGSIFFILGLLGIRRGCRLEVVQ